MSLAYVQSKFQKFTFAASQITMGASLTAGNKLYVIVAYSASGGDGINTGAYTVESTNGNQTLISRTVQGGDGTTPPVFTNNGALDIIYSIAVEISGNPAIENIVQNTSTSAPISGPTTTNNNDLAMLFSSNGSGFGSYTPASGWTNGQADGGGSTTFDYKLVPSSGTSLTASPSWSVGGTSGHWMSIALKVANSTETATGALAFGPIAFSASGGPVALSSGALAFGPIAFHGAGTVLVPVGSGGLAFAGLGIFGVGADLGKSPSNSNPSLGLLAASAILFQPLNWQVPIVNNPSGTPTVEFSRKWDRQFDIIKKQLTLNGTFATTKFVTQAVQSAFTAATQYTDAKVQRHVYAPCIVSALPAGVQGDRGFVTDSTQTTAAGIGTSVTGGGGNENPVYRDSSSWKIG
jgi:hypothetical protein